MYYSDELWLKLKPTDIDITVGPYETYIDEYQGLKSTYEMYVGIADKESTDKLQVRSMATEEEQLKGFAAYRYTPR